MVHGSSFGLRHSFVIGCFGLRASFVIGCFDIWHSPLEFRMTEIQRLSERVDALSFELDALRRRRDAVRGRPYDVRYARTMEWIDTEQPAYPRWAAGWSNVDGYFGCWLPIRFWEVDADGNRRYHSADVVDTAWFPAMWLPPNVDVQVARQSDGTWQIVRWPSLVHGRSRDATVNVAQWSTYYGGASCSLFTIATGIIHVYHHVAGESATWDQPQYYRNGDPVLMQFFTTVAGTVANGKFVSISTDAYGRWIVNIEPCGNVCLP